MCVCVCEITYLSSSILPKSLLAAPSVIPFFFRAALSIDRSWRGEREERGRKRDKIPHVISSINYLCIAYLLEGHVLKDGGILVQSVALQPSTERLKVRGGPCNIAGTFPPGPWGEGGRRGGRNWRAIPDN